MQGSTAGIEKELSTGEIMELKNSVVISGCETMNTLDLDCLEVGRVFKQDFRPKIIATADKLASAHACHDQLSSPHLRLASDDRSCSFTDSAFNPATGS